MCVDSLMSWSTYTGSSFNHFGARIANRCVSEGYRGPIRGEGVASECLYWSYRGGNYIDNYETKHEWTCYLSIGNLAFKIKKYVSPTINIFTSADCKWQELKYGSRATTASSEEKTQKASHVLPSPLRRGGGGGGGGGSPSRPARPTSSWVVPPLIQARAHIDFKGGSSSSPFALLLERAILQFIFYRCLP